MGRGRRRAQRWKEMVRVSHFAHDPFGQWASIARGPALKTVHSEEPPPVRKTRRARIDLLGASPPIYVTQDATELAQKIMPDAPANVVVVETIDEQGRCKPGFVRAGAVAGILGL